MYSELKKVCGNVSQWIESLKAQADMSQVKLTQSTLPTGLTEVFLRLRPTSSTKLDHV